MICNKEMIVDVNAVITLNSTSEEPVKQCRVFLKESFGPGLHCFYSSTSVKYGRKINPVKV